jgi:hypothetical protein
VGGPVDFSLGGYPRKSASFISRASRTKCSPLSYRVEVTLLNPFIGADQRRNVRSTTCVCGTAP